MDEYKYCSTSRDNGLEFGANKSQKQVWSSQPRRVKGVLRCSKPILSSRTPKRQEHDAAVGRRGTGRRSTCHSWWQFSASSQKGTLPGHDHRFGRSGASGDWWTTPKKGEKRLGWRCLWLAMGKLRAGLMLMRLWWRPLPLI